jgi:hypothetical protein
VKAVRHLAVALLVMAAVGCGSTPTPPGSADQGIRGLVLLGPTCPVETKASPCPDTPASGVTVRILRDGEPIDATATSDASGRFELALPPGHYTLEAIVGPDGPGMSAKPVDVTVPSGAFVEVVVPVDTGIR